MLEEEGKYILLMNKRMSMLDMMAVSIGLFIESLEILTRKHEPGTSQL